jgi:hypothetical protein
LAASIFPQLGHIYRAHDFKAAMKRSELLAFYLVSAVPKQGLMERRLEEDRHPPPLFPELAEG